MKNIFKIFRTGIIKAMFLAAALSCSMDKDGYVPVSRIELNKSTAEITVGNAEQLKAIVYPAEASDKNVGWFSDDTSIATVNHNGLVKGIGAGMTIIRITDGEGKNYPATCAVLVKYAEVPVTGVSLNKTAATISVNGSEQLNYTVTPSNALNKNVTWNSSNTAVAVVDSKTGIVTGISAGNAVITLTTEDGQLTSSCSITVQNGVIEVTGISLGKLSATVSVNGSEQLIANIVPPNATNKAVTWRSNDASVAVVDGNGVVTGISAGTAVITLATEDGQLTSSCTVTVQDEVIAVTGISLNKISATVSVNGSEQLAANVAPSNATDKAVIWRSNDASTATVDQNGLVTGISAGTATITATTEDGQFTSACSITVQDAAIAVTGVSPNKTAATISVNGSEQLTANITPPNATDKAVTWRSNDASVATVDQNGLVTGISAGIATITVTSEDGQFSSACTVTVQSAEIRATGVSLDKATLSITVNGSEQLTATVVPSNATNKNVTWASNRADVATVDGDGIVKGISAGTAVITATTEDGGFNHTCIVTVQSADIRATGVSLGNTALTVSVNGTGNLTATVTPSNATNKNVTWVSNNTGVATVNSDGVVTGVSVGTAAITVTTDDGRHTATCAVTVQNAAIAVTGVTLDKATLTVSVNGTENLAATVAPSNATNKNVTWASSDTDIAIVNNGLVRGISAGTADITATTEDGLITATCRVTVQNAAIAVTGVSLDRAALTVLVNNTETLSATVAPSNATNKNVTWASSNTGVATVDDSGAVKGISAGTAVITVTTADGGFDKTCAVTVQNAAIAVTGVTLGNTSLAVLVNNTVTLDATVAPSNATNKNVTWASNNTGVATVNSEGVVTGVSVGIAGITVTTEDGRFNRTCIVTVQNAVIAVTGVSLSKPSATILVNGTEQLTANITPSDATDKDVTWNSNNVSVATVGQNGVVTGISAGIATITVTTRDGQLTSTCTVTVQSTAIAVTGVSLNPATLAMYIGDTETLAATVAPSNATNKAVTWTSSNTGVATVNDGVVTGVSTGTATITATTEDGGYASTCAVTVANEMDNITATGWSAPVATDYEHSMTYVAQVAFRGTLSTDTDTEVAAFVNGEIRGYAKLVHEPQLNAYLVHLVIYSNSGSNETVVLKAYNPSKRRIYEHCEEFVFQGNTSLGSVSEILNCMP
jgi:uncharacterized protein YjdB